MINNDSKFLIKVEKNYNLFYIFKSTAFIFPILFIFLTKVNHLDNKTILQLSSLIILLSIVFNFIFSFISDILGYKRILLLGLLFQIGSCFGVIYFKGDLSYIIYLVCISLSASCISGIEKAMLKINYSLEDTNRFEQFYIKLNKNFYKYTSIFLIISPILYYFHEILPFYIQILNYIVSIYFLLKIPTKSNTTNLKKHKKYNFNQIVIAIKFTAKNKLFLMLTIVISVFEANIRVVDKLIQNTIINSININVIYLIGAIYFLSNIASYKSIHFFIKFINSSMHIKKKIIICTILLLISLLLLSSNNFILIIVGFIAINILKSLYRSIFITKQISSISFVNIATILSLSYIIGSIINSLLHYLSSLVNKITNINIYIILFIISTSLIFICLTFKTKNK